MEQGKKRVIVSYDKFDDKVNEITYSQNITINKDIMNEYNNMYYRIMNNITDDKKKEICNIFKPLKEGRNYVNPCVSNFVEFILQNRKEYDIKDISRIKDYRYTIINVK